jgi:putative hemolysin
MDGQSSIFIYIITIVILLILSSLFSASEMAFSSASKLRVKTDAENDKKAQKALTIIEDFENYLTTILVGNNIVNILLPLVASLLFVQISEQFAGILAFIFTTFFLLVFGEIVPKAYAKRNADKLVKRLSGFLKLSKILLKPVVIFFSGIQKAFLNLFKHDNSNVTATQEELATLVDTMSEEDVIDNENKDLIQSAIAFDTQTLDQVYRPRIDVFGIDANTPISEIKDLLMQNKFSRIPIYENTIDNIIGILYERDFLALLISQREFELKDVVRKTLYLNPNMRVSNALGLLQKEKVHMAVIIDEHGGTKGIVTLEDILEELVGEIYDEYDEEVTFFKKINDNEFLVRGEMNLESLFEDLLNYKNVPSTEQSTLSGWLYSQFETLPENNSTFEYEIYLFTITQIENRRISQVKIEIKK